MRPRSPGEYYLKALCIHPDRLSNADIKERCLDEEIDYISDAYIERLRKKLKPPEPFYPEDRNHAASFAFLVSEKINRFFQRDAAMRMALTLLETPRAKEFVEAMILVQVPVPAICAYVSAHRGVYCTPEGLALFQHYFWNIGLLSTTSMRVLLQMRVDYAVDNIKEYAASKGALKSAYYKDARKTAADLPWSPTTAALTQMRLGIKPGKHDIALRLMEARDIASIRAVEAGQQDGPGDSQKFLNYVNGSRILEELLQMSVRPEDTMRDQLNAIALRTETRELPSIHQLSGGEHTVDVSPLKGPEHDDSSESDEAPDESPSNLGT